MLSFQDITSLATPALLVPAAITIALTVFVSILLSSFRTPLPSKAPKIVKEEWPMIGALRFFTSRWDFFQHGRSMTPSGNFTFNIGRNRVVGLTGDKARQIFFDSRDLGFAEGYAVLFGQSPGQNPGFLQKENGSVTADPDFSGPGGYFSRRITRMLKTDSFGANLSRLMKDVKASLDKLANNPAGITDPFESIYRIVYQLTIRMVGCDDIADDPALLEKTLGLYETVEKSTTPLAIIFPWFPSFAIIRRTIAGGRLYMILNNIVEERKKTGKRGTDPLQFLIDQGDSMARIIEFVIGALFAGLLNSGINAAWVLCYLAKDKYWLQKAREEVIAVAAQHNPGSTAPLTEQLSNLSSDVWESGFPVLDLCLRDSIRLQLLGTAFRKNISGKDLPIGVNDEVIPKDAFVAYALADVHQDPLVYKEPEKWDPARYLPDRAEDKKKPYSYLGWGAGRHPCLGMRFAKLEQNVIVAFFIATFDFELTDKNGVPLEKTSPTDTNGHSATKPKEKMYLKYSQREVAAH